MMNDPLSNAGLTICIDFSNLSTYVALLETKKLVDDFALEVHWLPLVKSGANRTSKSGDDGPMAAYKARRADAREKFAREELLRNCRYLDISEELGSREFDTTYLAQGLLWLEEVDVSAGDYWRYMDTVFAAMFREQQVIETADQIIHLLDQSGVAVSGVSDFLGKNELPAVQEKLLQGGVFESPTFIYQGERYLGRQHHPLLRWILGGKEGQAPV